MKVVLNALKINWLLKRPKKHLIKGEGKQIRGAFCNVFK